METFLSDFSHTLVYDSFYGKKALPINLYLLESGFQEESRQAHGAQRHLLENLSLSSWWLNIQVVQGCRAIWSLQC